MYTIKREDGRIVIENWKGEMIYTATNDAYLIHGTDTKGQPTVEKIGNLPDAKRLAALFNAKKLEF